MNYFNSTENMTILHCQYSVAKMKSSTHDAIKDEDEDGNDIESLDPCLAGNNPHDTEDMSTDISVLKSNDIIDSSIQKHFIEAKSLMLKQIPSTSLSLMSLPTLLHKMKNRKN